MKITFKDLEDANCDSVTDYCRLLVSENNTDLNQEILVYRGDMLCLTVKSIAEGAKLRPNGVGFSEYSPRHDLKGS